MYLYLAFDKYKKGYNQRLIEYGHLVLGTRSAAKFEQVPSSIGHAHMEQQAMLFGYFASISFPEDPNDAANSSGKLQEIFSDRWTRFAMCSLVFLQRSSSNHRLDPTIYSSSIPW